jgi:hypothetical protein
MAHTVAIVVDREFGDPLVDLSQKMHVWVCDSPTNKRSAEAVRVTSAGQSIELGVTTFRIADQDSPETMLLDVLDTVDLHHGSYSHNPPWSELHIYGTTATPGVQLALAKFGARVIDQSQNGFRCARQVTGAA